MSVSEIMQSEETQRLLERVSKIEAQRETKTVAFMPLFGMYAPTDTGISTEEQLNEYLSKEKDIVANYERSIIDEYSFDFKGKGEWYNEQESRYRTRLTDYLAEHKGEYTHDDTFCYLAEMKARYIDVDSFDISKDEEYSNAVRIVGEKAGIKNFLNLAEGDHIILDTETTGFSKTEDDVIELGITDINGNVLYDGMFKPDRENSSIAESANHISNAELQDKPTIFDEWEKIKAAVAGRKIATYNLDFDKNIMINAAARHGVPREEVEKMFEQSACIMQSYTTYKNGYRATKLQNALTENGIEVTQDHRAVSDCKVTAQLIQAVKERDRAFKFIAEYSSHEFELDYEKELADLKSATTEQLHNIGLAHTTHPDVGIPIQATADLIDLKITYTFGNEAYRVDSYNTLEEMNLDLQNLDFSELTEVPDEVVERYIKENSIGQNEKQNEMNNTYSIYQLKKESQREYGFMPYSANEGKVTFDNYDLVYQGNLEDIKSDNDFAKLNYVYNMFNLNHPADFTGHSLSMSDVVVLSNDHKEQAYYVDRFGFAEMPEFIQQKNREELQNTIKEPVTLTDRSAAIESSEDINAENFSFLKNMETYRIIVPNATLTNVSALNNVSYHDIESARRELNRLGYEEVPYEDMIRIVGDNMIEEHRVFSQIYEANRPYVHIEWSEHHEIKDNSDYSLSEFSHLMEKLDKEWIEKRESGDQNYEGYAKTKFIINNAFGGIDKETGEQHIGTITCRQDIGDGDGSVANHIKLVAEGDLIMISSWGKDNVSNYEELETSAHARINYVAPYIEYAVSREDNARQIEREQNTGKEKEAEQEIGRTPSLEEVEKEIESSFADELKNAQKIAEFIVHSDPELSEDDFLSVYYRDNENGEIYNVTKSFEEIEVEHDGEVGVVDGSFTRGIAPEKLVELADKATTNSRFEVVMPLSDEVRELFTESKEQIEENSIGQNEPEPQALMSIEISGEVHYFKTSKSADEIINSAQGEKALLSAQEQNEEISSAEYAEIQQSRSFTFSVDMNLDDDTAKIYSVNDGKGGIPEGERTAENTNTTEIKISEFGKTKEEVKQEQITEEKEQKPQKIEPVTRVVIGNISYRFIKDKTFINTTAIAAKEIADLLDKNNVNYSGIIEGELGTITVPKAKYNEVMRLIEAAKIDLNKKGTAVKDDNGKVLLDSKEAVDSFIKDRIKDIMDSQKFINFCKSDNLFLMKKYSLNNALLIIGQNPKASYCCSAKQWQQYGRIINKGEKGIKILCPILLSEANKARVWGQIKRDIKATYTEKNGFGEATLPNTNVKITGYNGLYDVHFNGKPVISHADENLVKKFIDQKLLGRTILGYKLGTVFDVSQTNNNTEYVWLKAGQFDKKDLIYGDNGKPITNRAGEYKVNNTEERKNSFNPVLSAKIDPQDKDKMALLYDILKDVSSKNHCPVTEAQPTNDKELKEAKGYYVPRENRIVIRESMEITEKVATLLHEMAHSQMHNLTEQAKNKSTVKEKEVQAEAVACLVANNYGIDTEHSSFDYIAHFVESRNLEYLENSLKVIWNGARELSAKIENEITERGLDLNLEAEKPFSKEQVGAIKKNYIEIAQDIKDITQENIHNALNSYKQSVVTEVKEQRKQELSLFDKMTAECDKICLKAERLEKVNTRPLQKNFISEIKAGFERLTVLAQETSKIESELKEINVPETPQQEFLSYPMNYMNKDDNFKNVSVDDKKIIAQSRFIAENYSYLLNSAPDEFKKYAVQQAEHIHNAMSKNGTAVEIVNAENYGTKIQMEKGMVMHPVLAEKSFKQTEMEICMAKKKAERNGEVFPSAKTDVTIYSNLDTITAKGVAALHTSVYVGEGQQIGLAEHLAKVCTGKGLARAELCDNFYDSQVEKGDKTKKLYRAEIPKIKETPKQAEHEQQHVQTRDMSAWKERASAVKSEHENSITQEQNERDNDHDPNKNNVTEKEMFE